MTGALKTFLAVPGAALISFVDGNVCVFEAAVVNKKCQKKLDMSKSHVSDMVDDVLLKHTNCLKNACATRRRRELSTTTSREDVDCEVCRPCCVEWSQGCPEFWKPETGLCGLLCDQVCFRGRELLGEEEEEKERELKALSLYNVAECTPSWPEKAPQVCKDGDDSSSRRGLGSSDSSDDFGTIAGYTNCSCS